MRGGSKQDDLLKSISAKRVQPQYLGATSQRPSAPAPLGGLGLGEKALKGLGLGLVKDA